MPGPVSDSYDPEFGTSSNADGVRSALDNMYNTVSHILKDKVPIYILDLVQEEGMMNSITAQLTEKEWRIIRFALERVRDSV